MTTETMNSFSNWLTLLRPKTLTASLVPFVAGTALAYADGASIHFSLLFFALLSAFFIQTGTNLINDSFDYQRGADNKKRLGPIRAVQLGLASAKQVYIAGLVSFAGGFLFGIPLIVHGGAPIAAVLILSVIAGYCYTGGPLSLAYIGLGDLFVLIFFGWVATGAAYWLQTGIIDKSSLVLGTQIGLLCTALVAVNNLRDVDTDRAAKKKTLAVRFGKTFARMEIGFLACFPFLLSFYWLKNGYAYAALMPWMSFFLAIILAKKVAIEEPSKNYNQFLGLAALLHLSFGVLLTLGFIMK